MNGRMVKQSVRLAGPLNEEATYLDDHRFADDWAEACKECPEWRLDIHGNSMSFRGSSKSCTGRSAVVELPQSYLSSYRVKIPCTNSAWVTGRSVENRQQ